MVRAEVNRADPELEELRVQPPNQSNQRINTRIKRNLLLVKEVVRGLDTNDEEDWAADEVKVLQEDVEEQEHHARDANISMKYLIKDHVCNI